MPRTVPALTDSLLEQLERTNDPSVKSHLMKGLALSQFRDGIYEDRERFLDLIKSDMYELCEKDISTQPDRVLLQELQLLLDHKGRSKTKQGMSVIRRETSRVLAKIIISVWAAESELKC